MRPRTILLADHNANDALLMTRAFKKTGFRGNLRCVTDGEEAKTYLCRSQAAGTTANPSLDYPMPDMLLLDLGLPGRTGKGLEVLEWIRTQPRLRTMAVVILASAVNTVEYHTALSLDANAFLLKPNSFEEIKYLANQLHMFLSHGAPKARPAAREMAL